MSGKLSGNEVMPPKWGVAPRPGGGDHGAQRAGVGQCGFLATVGCPLQAGPNWTHLFFGRPLSR